MFMDFLTSTWVFVRRRRLSLHQSLDKSIALVVKCSSLQVLNGYFVVVREKPLRGPRSGFGTANIRSPMILFGLSAHAYAVDEMSFRASSLPMFRPRRRRSWNAD